VIVAIADPDKARSIQDQGEARGVRVICALAQENDVYFMIQRAQQLRARG
jgi:hypothetical protein